MLCPADMATTWVNMTLFSKQAVAMRAPFTATTAPALLSSSHAVLEKVSSEGPVQTIKALFLSISPQLFGVAALMFGDWLFVRQKFQAQSMPFVKTYPSIPTIVWSKQRDRSSLSPFLYVNILPGGYNAW